jgi:Domain of unknown function (DUF5615)
MPLTWPLTCRRPSKRQREDSLDENFPLRLHRRLKDAGYDAEHILTLGRRGAPDSYIRDRLKLESDLVFLTQDTEFEELGLATTGTVIISRLPQSLPIGHRVDIWQRAIQMHLATQPDGRMFQVLESGELRPYEPRRRTG